MHASTPNTIGRGRIDARPVVIGGDDFTVRGGANDAGLREKVERAEMMAHALRLPGRTAFGIRS